MSLGKLLGFTSEPDTTVTELMSENFSREWLDKASRLPITEYTRLISELASHGHLDKLEQFLRKYRDCKTTRKDVETVMIHRVQPILVHLMVTRMPSSPDLLPLLQKCVDKKYWQAAEHLVFIGTEPTPELVAQAATSDEMYLAEHWMPGKKSYQPLFEAYIAKSVFDHALSLLREERPGKKNKLSGNLQMLEKIADQNWPLYTGVLNRLPAHENLTMQQLCLLANKDQRELLLTAWRQSTLKERDHFLEWVHDESESKVLINLDLGRSMVTQHQPILTKFINNGEWVLANHLLKNGWQALPEYLDPAVKAGKWPLVKRLLRNDNMEPSQEHGDAAKQAGELEVLNRMVELGMNTTEEDINRYFLPEEITGMCALEVNPADHAPLLANRLRRSKLKLSPAQLEFCFLHKLLPVIEAAIRNDTPFHQVHYDLVLKWADTPAIRALLFYMGNPRATKRR